MSWKALSTLLAFAAGHMLAASELDIASKLRAFGLAQQDFEVLVVVDDYLEIDQRITRALIEPDFGTLRQELPELLRQSRSMLQARQEYFGNEAWQVRITQHLTESVEKLLNLDDATWNRLTTWWKTQYGLNEEGNRHSPEAIETLTSLLGPTHAITLHKLNQLATMQDAASGSPKAAEATFERLRDLYVSTFGANSPVVAGSLFLLSSYPRDRSEYEAASRLLLSALEIQRSSLGENSYLYAKTLNRLASVNLRRDRPQEATTNYGKALPIYRRALGETHASTITLLNNLAWSLEKQQLYASAEPFYREALAARQRSLEPAHPQIASSMANLADVLRRQDRLREAIELYQKAIEIQTLPENRGDGKDLLILLVKIGMLYDKLKEHRRAEEFFRRAMPLSAEVNSPSSVGHITLVTQLASSSYAQGKLQESEELLKQAIATLETFPSNDEPLRRTELLVMTWTELSRTLRSQNRPVEANEAAQKAVLLAGASPDASPRVRALALLGLARLNLSVDTIGPDSHLMSALELLRSSRGQHRPDQATDVLNRAELESTRGDSAAAEASYKEALDLRRALVGDQVPLYADALTTYAGFLSRAHRHAEAEPLLRQVSSIRRSAVGEAHISYSSALLNLAACLLEMERSGEAEPLIRQAIKIRKDASREADETFAYSIDQLARTLFSQARYDEAEDLYRQAIAIYKNERSTSARERSLCEAGLARLLMERGRFDEAEEVSTLAIEGATRYAIEPDPASVSEHHRILAEIYSETARFEEAKEHGRKGMELALKAFGEESLIYTSSLSTMAGVFDAIGEYQQSEPLLRASIEIIRKIRGDRHRDLSSSLNRLGINYLAQKRYRDAETVLYWSLEIANNTTGGNHPRSADSQVNLALCKIAQGNPAEAVPLLKTALAIYEHSFGKLHPTYIRTAAKLGEVMLSLGSITAGSEHILDAVVSRWGYATQTLPRLPEAIKRRTLENLDLPQLDLLYELAFSHSIPATVAAEASLATKGMLIESNRADNAMLLRMLSESDDGWADRVHRLNSLKAQFANASVQNSLLERSHFSVSPERLTTLLQEIAKTEQDLRRSYVSQPAAVSPEVPSLDEIVASLENNALVEYVIFRPSRGQSTPVDHYGALVSRRGAGTVAIDLGPVEEVTSAVASFRGRTNEYIAQWKSNRYELNPSARQLRAQLSEKPGEAGVLSETLTAIAGEILRKRIWDPLTPHLAGISRVYLAPESTLSLVPFEALAAPDPKTGWRYLVEDYEFIYLNTGRDLARFVRAEPGPPTSAAILIGNPSFSAEPIQLAGRQALTPRDPTAGLRAGYSAPSASLGKMPGLKTLRRSIGRDWPVVPELATLLKDAQQQLLSLGWDVRIFQEDEATKRNVLSVSRPRLLQLATHGYTLDPPSKSGEWDDPMLRSMLLFSGVNRWTPETAGYYRINDRLLPREKARAEGLDEDQLARAYVEVDNGVLTAFEVSAMDLRGTELVSLTACETGIGEVTAAGVASLRQAFILAGARAVTASLWEVPAKETVDQTNDFYRRWLSPHPGRPPPSRYGAFRAAQLAALERARQEQANAHPFWWAGTVYVGDPGDLPIEPTYP